MDYPHLSDLQRAEFQILKAFDDICKRYNIKYYLADGTLLGAVRHKGFIPWDDDIDITMTRPEFEKFKSIADIELPESMFLSTFDTPGHIWLIPRIIDSNTRFYLNNAAKQKEIGAWIDFLVLDGVPKPGLKKTIWSFLFMLARLLYQFSNFSVSVNLNRKDRSLSEKAAIKIAMFTHIEKILNPVKMGHFYEWICTRNDFSKCDYCCMLSNSYEQRGVIPKIRGIIPKKWIGNGVQYQFEDLTVYGFEETDRYLTFLYGDYMQLPPIEERKSIHSVTKVED